MPEAAKIRVPQVMTGRVVLMEVTDTSMGAAPESPVSWTV